MKFIITSIIFLSALSTHAFAQTDRALDFMDGRWQGKMGDMIAVSHYIGGDERVFIGRTYLKNAQGQTQAAMLMRVDAFQNKLTLTPFFNQQQRQPLVAIQILKNSVIFENPNSPFPSRISYFLNGDGTLTTRIEGTTKDGPVVQEMRQGRIP